MRQASLLRPTRSWLCSVERSHAQGHAIAAVPQKEALTKPAVHVNMGVPALKLGLNPASLQPLGFFCTPVLAMPHATLSDVARASGVTHVTVSRAFSGKGPVAATTRARIFRAAEELGYRPSAAARGRPAPAPPASSG